MKFYNLLSEKKSAVLNRWYDAALESYPPDTSSFLKGQKNPFLNPVGSTIFQGIENIFEELLCENNPPSLPHPPLTKGGQERGKGSMGGFSGERVSQFLDDIIRIKAVQDFTASQSVAFILLLKKVIREEMKNEIAGYRLHEELLEFESRIDAVTLMAFDVYMKCREKLYELKVNELRRLTFGRLQKADRIYKQENDLKSNNNEALERKEVAT